MTAKKALASLAHLTPVRSSDEQLPEVSLHTPVNIGMLVHSTGSVCVQNIHIVANKQLSES